MQESRCCLLLSIGDRRQVSEIKSVDEALRDANAGTLEVFVAGICCLPELVTVDNRSQGFELCREWLTLVIVAPM